MFIASTKLPEKWLLSIVFGEKLLLVQTSLKRQKVYFFSVSFCLVLETSALFSNIKKQMCKSHFFGFVFLFSSSSSDTQQLSLNKQKKKTNYAFVCYLFFWKFHHHKTNEPGFIVLSVVQSTLPPIGIFCQFSKQAKFQASHFWIPLEENWWFFFLHWKYKKKNLPRNNTNVSLSASGTSYRFETPLPVRIPCTYKELIFKFNKSWKVIVNCSVVMKSLKN